MQGADTVHVYVYLLLVVCVFTATVRAVAFA